MLVTSGTYSKRNSPSKTVSVSRIILVDDVVIHADLKIVKMCAATGSASVLGHTYGLMTTSAPSIQRGSRSSRTTKELQQHDSVVWWRTKRPWLRQADGWKVEQREEGERDKCVGRGSSHPSLYRRGREPQIWGAPTSPLIM